MSLLSQTFSVSHSVALRAHDSGLTFLSVCITQAIVSIGKGKSVSMDDITDFVSKVSKGVTWRPQHF